MGGDGGAGKAQRASQRAEEERQARISRTIAGIDQVFAAPERQSQYDDFLGALREHYTGDATRQREVADRGRRFAMARSGLTGGTADRDSRITLGDEFQRAIIDAENRAQGALGDLRMQDESLRGQLTQLAQSGLDATTAARRAGEGLRASAESVRGSSLSTGLGNAFATTLGAVDRQQNEAARRRGMTTPVGSLYGTNSEFGR